MRDLQARPRARAVVREPMLLHQGLRKLAAAAVGKARRFAVRAGSGLIASTGATWVVALIRLAPELPHRRGISALEQCDGPHTVRSDMAGLQEDSPSTSRPS